MDPLQVRGAADQQPDGEPTPLEWTLAATLVDETYKLYLGRGAQPDEVEHTLKTIRNGLAPAAFVDGVKNSEEAVRRAAVPSLDRGSAEVAVQLVYQVHMGRLPTDSECETWVGVWMAGRGLESCVAEIAASPEAKSIVSAKAVRAGVELPGLDLESAGTAVQLMYQVHLGRLPTNSERETWAGVLMAGRGLESCVAEIAASPEAKSIVNAKALRAGVEPPRLDPESANVAVQLMYQVHLGRSPRDREREAWAGVLMAGKGLESCVAEIAASPEAKSLRMSRSRSNRL